jgi:hypothetical protein
MAEDTKVQPYFPHNWRYDVEIDTAGGLDPTNIENAKFASIAAFTTNIVPAPGDVINNTAYYIDKDASNAEVTGHAKTYAITGNVLIGDPACDYILNLEKMDATGNDAKTLMRLTYPDGTTKVMSVTVENIVPAGGNGNAKANLTFTLAQNGTAIVTDPAGTVQNGDTSHDIADGGEDTTTGGSDDGKSAGLPG